MKPVIKVSSGRGKIAPWIVERFPASYREMTYVEPFLGDGCVFLQKDPSREEVLNEPDEGLASVWRAMRDEPGLLVSKLKRTVYSESTFKRHQNRTGTGDYLSLAISEFLLRQMSKSGMKKSFVPRSESSECRGCWKGLFESMESVHERVKESFFLCRNAVEVLKVFSNENTLAYCDLPEGLADDVRVEIGEALRDFRGKVIVLGQNSAINRRTYDGWNRRGLPGNPKESAWINF